MNVELETDEILEVMIDGACEFRIVGERNEEGTMKLRVKEGWEEKQ